MGTGGVVMRTKKSNNQMIHLDRRGRPTKKSAHIIAKAMADAVIRSSPKKYQTEKYREYLENLFYGGGSFGTPNETNSLSYNLVRILLSPGGSIPLRMSYPPIKTKWRLRLLKRNLKKALTPLIPGGIKSSKKDIYKPDLVIKASYKKDILTLVVKKIQPKVQKISIVPKRKPDENEDKM